MRQRATGRTEGERTGVCVVGGGAVRAAPNVCRPWSGVDVSVVPGVDDGRTSDPPAGEKRSRAADAERKNCKR